MTPRVSGSPEEKIEIGLARLDELPFLADLERRAASIFPPGTLPKAIENDALPFAVIREAQASGRLFVARLADEAKGESQGDGMPGVVGFVLVADVDGQAHLEELDVDPNWGRRGIGSRLVRQACEWAEGEGYARITLSTFRDVPWNGPFYGRMGFAETDTSLLGPGLARRRAAEAQSGFDLSERCVMVRATVFVESD